MARPIVLSNGELHVGLNNFGMVHDFYYPYVGFENHALGPDLQHHIGIWVDGEISWLDNLADWSFTFRYPYPALIGHTIAKNERLKIILEFDDFVDAKVSAFIRDIHIINIAGQARQVRLFMHQAFAIGDSRSNTDTAQYLPDSQAVLHYRGRRAFVVSGLHKQQAFDQHTIGLFGIEGKQGTHLDAEDGELSMNNVEHGRVDSTIRFLVDLPANSSERVYYWISAGTSPREAIYIHKKIADNKAMVNLKRTFDWWDEWLEPAYRVLPKIPVEHRNLFLQSLMIMKSQIDKRGAVLASTDSSMLNYSRDAYGYSWPRDGAYVIWPLIRLGYKEEAHRFFEFSKRGLHSNGYLMHKYRPDGAIGSSWHPYIHEGGVVAPPIQEDETALVLFVFAQFYQINHDPNLLKQFYKDMVVPMANFLANFVNNKTGLPHPSYDLWEEVYLTSTYTTALTCAALFAASELAVEADDKNNAVAWRLIASDIKSAGQKYLYNPDRQVFYKGLYYNKGKITYNETVDSSSVLGAYLFGLFDPDSPEIKNSLQIFQQVFGVDQGAIGVPRYENDVYRRTSPEVLGNKWPVTSLWLAQYYLDNNQEEEALKILDWVKNHSLSTGVMPEQINPVNDSLVSPAPLTWSHAEYVSTILDMITNKNNQD